MKWLCLSLLMIVLLVLAYNNKETTKRVVEFLKWIAEGIKSVKDNILK